MVSLDVVFFVIGILLLLGIASSKFSMRIGMPVLVLFLGVGMLAGSEGLGGIAFEDHNFANDIASAALALILFDGGLRTSTSRLRMVWGPALVLSTVGVVLTSVITGVAAAWVLHLPLFHGMLLGSIVGSTDAAAVFSILRTCGMKLPDRISAALEVESGSNDPMAIFLTVGCISLIKGDSGGLGQLPLLFVSQFGVGGLVGLGVAFAAAWLINRINLDSPGLYPLLALSSGAIAFGLASILGGSGFLAVYVGGIVLGNRSIVFRNGIFLFHDAAAWLGQIVLFVMLGLLSFPSHLTEVVWEGLLIALVLILVARPVAVLLSILPFHFNAREVTFLSWVGLKGAVPITLAIFPLSHGVVHGELIFNVVFFVVLISAVTQGWSLPLVARWLKLGTVSDDQPPLNVEIVALRHVDGEIVEYRVRRSSAAAGKALRHLAFPHDVTITLVVRDGEVLIPRGSTVLQPGDYVFAAMRRRVKPLIDRLFDVCDSAPGLTPGQEILFRADHTLGHLCDFLNLPCPAEAGTPLGDLAGLARQGAPFRVGSFLIGPGHATRGGVGLVYQPDGGAEPPVCLAA